MQRVRRDNQKNLGQIFTEPKLNDNSHIIKQVITGNANAVIDFSYKKHPNQRSKQEA